MNSKNDELIVKAWKILNTTQFKNYPYVKQLEIIERLENTPGFVPDRALSTAFLSIKNNSWYTNTNNVQLDNIEEFQEFRDLISNNDAEIQYLHYREIEPLRMRGVELFMSLNDTDKVLMKTRVFEPFFALEKEWTTINYKDFGGDKVFETMKDMRYHPEKYTNEQRRDIMEELRPYYNASINNLAVQKRRLDVLTRGIAVFEDRLKRGLLGTDEI